MSGLLGVVVRSSSASYEIFPIEQREEDQQEFVPYGKGGQRRDSRLAQSLQLKLTRVNLSQSLDCKNRQQLKVARCKTQQKDGAKTAIKLSSLEINTSLKLLPRVIHSIKKDPLKTQEKSINKNRRLVRLQTEMKKHPPVLFKEGYPGSKEKPVRVLVMDAFRSNDHLNELKSRPTNPTHSNKISGKQLKKLMRVEKVQSSWHLPFHQMLSRSRRAQIP